MIFDVMENAKLYEAVHPGIAKAMEALRGVTAQSFSELPSRVELDGDRVFFFPAEYQTKPLSESVSEAHRKYIDVMYMVEGEENIYVKPVSNLKKIDKPYDASRDALLTAIEPDVFPVHLKAGCFVVLFPQDTHAPGCCVDMPERVKKIICKVKV